MGSHDSHAMEVLRSIFQRGGDGKEETHVSKPMFVVGWVCRICVYIYIYLYSFREIHLTCSVDSQFDSQLGSSADFITNMNVYNPNFPAPHEKNLGET